MGDFAELGVHAGRKHDGARLTGNGGGAGEHQIFGGERGILLIRFGVAAHGPRLTADRRRVHSQAEGLDQPAIGRHLIALFQQDHVAGNQQFHVEHLRLTVAHRLDLLRQQPAQRLQRPLGAVLLPEREHAVDQDDADDRHPQLPHALPRPQILGEKGQRRGHPENEREEMGEFAGKAQPQRSIADLFDPIGAEFAVATRRFACAQAGG